MLNLYKTVWYRIIASVLIITFLALDASWAYPPDQTTAVQNLSTQSSFNPMSDHSGSPQEMFKTNADLQMSLLSIGRFLLGNKEKGQPPIPLYWMEEVLTAYPEDARYFTNIDLSKVSIDNGVILLPYKFNGKEYVIQIAAKGFVGEDRLKGYAINISGEFFAKVVSKEQISGQDAPSGRSPGTVLSNPTGYILPGLMMLMLLSGCTLAEERRSPDAEPGVTAVEPARKSVRIDGRMIVVNNEPYLIRGLCWHPVAQYKDRRDGADYLGTYRADIRLMASMGVNAIRVYEPIEEKEVLDALNEAGIKVVIGVPYFDDRYKPGPDLKGGKILDYIAKFKDHPAILMWELGNEYNYHPEWFGGDVNNWYKFVNEIAGKIHAIDPSHPVTTAHGEVPAKDVFKMLPNIDGFGLNVYRDQDSVKAVSEFIDRSKKFVYNSEVGSRLPIQKDRAETVVLILSGLEKAFKDRQANGGFFFEFDNESWKKMDNGWGVKGTLVEHALRAIWKDGKSPEDVIKAIKDGPATPAKSSGKLYSFEPFSIAFALSLGAPVVLLGLAILAYVYMYPYIYTRVRLWRYFGYLKGNLMYNTVKPIIRSGKSWRMKIAGEGMFSTDVARIIVDSVSSKENHDPILRMRVIEVLGSIKDPRVVQPIAEAKSDEDSNVGQAAQDASNIPAVSPVENVKAPEEISQSKPVQAEVAAEDVESLFGKLGVTINNHRAQFVHDANALLADVAARDVIFEKTMTVAELKSNLVKLSDAVRSLEADAAAQHLTALQQLQKDIVKVEINALVASIIARSRRVEEGEKLIIGVETDWIPGLNEKGYGTQHDAMNGLISELQSIGEKFKAVGINNVEIIIKDKAELQQSVLSMVESTHTRMSNVVILGSEDSIIELYKSGAFARSNSLGEIEIAFLAGIDVKGLADTYKNAKDSGKIIDVNITEMLLLALELAIGKEPPKDMVKGDYKRGARMVVLLPKVQAADYEEMKSLYDRQRDILQSA